MTAPAFTYCALADVRNILDPDASPGDMGSAAGLSDSQLGVACEEAQAEVDARIGARYSGSLPLTPVPLVVKNATRDIAAYKATLTYLKGLPMATTDPVWLRYQDAKAVIAGIANGTIVIPNGPATITPEDSTSSDDLVINEFGDCPIFIPRDAGLSTLGGRLRVNPFERQPWN